jgi:hypothetical protein
MAAIVTSLRKLGFYAAFAVALPLLPLLTLGRVVFFAALNAWDSRRRQKPAQTRRSEP